MTYIVPAQTVVEMPNYAQRAEELMSEIERDAVINMVAYNPRCGVVIRGTGGVRKVRVPLQGRGKRGGARVIYYFHNETLPVFLLDIFAKNERSDLTPRQKKSLASAVAELTRSAGRTEP